MILLDVTCHAREHGPGRSGCVCPDYQPAPRQVSTQPRTSVRRYRSLTDEERRAAVAEYVEGDTFHELAVRYGCSPGQIRHIVQAAGVRPRPRGESLRVLSRAEMERAACEYEDGESLAALGARYGCAPSNGLAHGSISFVDCAQNIVVSELRGTAECVGDYLREIIECFERYISTYNFLRPDRRPAGGALL